MDFPIYPPTHLLIWTPRLLDFRINFLPPVYQLPESKASWECRILSLGRAYIGLFFHENKREKKVTLYQEIHFYNEMEKL